SAGRPRSSGAGQRVEPDANSQLIEATLRARGPYSLRLSTRHGSDATRVAAGGVLRAVYENDGGLEIAEARQLPDGAVLVRSPSEATIERVRFTLGLDDDHSEFLQQFSRDPFLGATVRRLKGLRPLRCATVTQALLRALCGQLITARRAREIERRIVRETTPSFDGLYAAPTPATFARFAPAQLRRLGLGMPRASALVRLCRSLDLGPAQRRLAEPRRDRRNRTARGAHRGAAREARHRGDSLERRRGRRGSADRHRREAPGLRRAARGDRDGGDAGANRAFGSRRDSDERDRNTACRRRSRRSRDAECAGDGARRDRRDVRGRPRGRGSPRS